MNGTYLDIIDRSRSGESINKQDWDMQRVLLPVKMLVKKHALSWEKQQVVPHDDAMLERLFEAGMELAVNSGMYCVSTGRVIRFSRDELEWGVKNAPQQLEMGEGKDLRVLRARKVEDDQPPLIWAGNPGAPTPEELFVPTVKSWAQEPLVDLLTCGSLTTAYGRPLGDSQLLEIAAARWELANLREALRQVGRPGMGLLAGQSAVTEAGDLAISHPGFLRTCDAHIIALFNEMMIDNVNMARVVNAETYGMRNASLACVMVGGLGGDAPGAAVVQIASIMLANLACRAHYHLLHPIHIRHVATSTRAVMWVQSAVAQAFSRCAPCILVADIYPKSGALTRELLYEVAANALVCTVSGAHLEGVGAADGALPNGTGLEVRWMAEVSRKATEARLTRGQANALALALLAKYEHIFDNKDGNPGVRFDQTYDMETIEPIPAWREMYEQVKEEVFLLSDFR